MAKAEHVEPPVPLHDGPVIPPTEPSRRLTIVGESNAPIQRVDWKIDMYDRVTFDLYQHAMFDLISIVVMKIGQEFTKAEHSGDTTAAVELVNKMTRVIQEA